jgi:hypothetical protein
LGHEIDGAQRCGRVAHDGNESPERSLLLSAANGGELWEHPGVVRRLQNAGVVRAGNRLEGCLQGGEEHNDAGPGQLLHGCEEVAKDRHLVHADACAHRLLEHGGDDIVRQLVCVVVHGGDNLCIELHADSHENLAQVEVRRNQREAIIEGRLGVDGEVRDLLG